MEDIGVTLDREKKEGNYIKFLQIEVFKNETSTSKVYHANFILT